jgi:hypothetical protein
MIRILFIAALVALAFPADAQPRCFDRAQALERWRAEAGAQVVGRGLTGEGVMVELVLTEDGGFVVVASQPIGIGCAVIAGRHWYAVEPEPEGEDG